MKFLVTLLQNFKDFKKSFYPKLQNFCFKHQDEIFFLFCALYFCFLVVVLDICLASIIFFWCGIIYLIIYALKLLKVPTLEILVIAVLLTKIYHLVIWLRERGMIRTSIHALIFLFVFLGVVYIYLSHTLVFLKIRTFLKDLKIASDILKNHLIIEFKHFDTLRIMSSCGVVGIILVCSIKNTNFYNLFISIDSEHQGYLVLFLINLLFFISTMVLVESVILEAFNTPTLGYMRYLLKGRRVIEGVGVYCFAYGADQFLLSPSIPSYPIFSQYRIFRVGYTWNFSFEPTLASEYQKLTGGLMPPLLENYMLDSIKTRDRIETLNLFKAAQADSYSAYSKTTSSPKDLIRFRTQQTEAYNLYVQEVDKGRLRSQKPKIPRIEFFYKDKNKLEIGSRIVENEED